MTVAPVRGGRPAWRAAAPPRTAAPRASRDGRRVPSPREQPGRCRPAARAATAPDDGARGSRAAALDADDRYGPARPGRPPSRRRSRPRASGRSGRDQAHRTRAAERPMSSMKGTCVRKIGRPSDGSFAVGRAHPGSRSDLALGVGSRHGRAASEVAATGRRRRTGGAARGVKQGHSASTRTPVVTWLLR